MATTGRLTAAIVAFNAVSLFSFGVEPIVASQLGARLGLSEHAVGWVLASEFGGSMLATFAAFAWSRRLSARGVAVWAGILFVLANLAAALYQSYDALLLSRALAGFAAGTLLILTLTVAARDPRPARLYGFWVIGQTLVAAPGLLFFPQLSSRFGLGAIYCAMAAGMALVLPLARAFSAVRAVLSHERAAGGRPRLRSAVVVLTVLFLYYLVADGLWGFAADRGKDLNLAPAAVGWVLAAAYLLSLAGAGLAAWLGAPRRCRDLAIAGHVGLAVSLLMFATANGLAAFAVFAVILQFAWAFTAPLLMALTAEIEPVGSMIAPATFVMGAGLTMGPPIAGYLLEFHSGPRVTSLAFAALVMAGTLLLRLRAGTQSLPAS